MTGVWAASAIAFPKPVADYADIARLLDDVELFDDFGDTALRSLAAWLSLREFAAGEVIFCEGDVGGWMGFLVSGEIRVTKSGDADQSYAIATEHRSRSIGEMALIDGEPRSATCIAVKPSRLLILTREHFHLLAQERAGVALEVVLRIARLLSRRLRMTSGQLVDHLGE